jgi:hypothetical protein
MRKLIITVASLLALAIPTAAMASVAVENGVGFVGKGDVQTALGYHNDAAIQQAVKDGKIKFSLGAEKVNADYMMSCYGSDAVGHTIIVQPGTMSVTAQARVNPQGKLTTGWDLTGTGTGFTAAGNAFIRTVPCPEGSFMYMNLGQGDLWNKVVPTGDGTLSVTNGTTTVALPNTPIV